MGEHPDTELKTPCGENQVWSLWSCGVFNML